MHSTVAPPMLFAKFREDRSTGSPSKSDGE